jgi:uncharacterized membrane-anchored protein
MTTTTSRRAAPLTARQLFNKVPEVTVFFWIIKVLATTVGETAADFLNDHLGLTGTTLVISVLLVGALVAQFRSERYVPVKYWVTVVLISVVGTLASDNLVDNFGVPLAVTTVAFAVALGLTFRVWYRREHTLSIHTIVTPRREAYYWAAILFTFALGTSAGDLVAEEFSLGYRLSAIIFGALICVVAVVWARYRVNAVLSFWAAYILTRPLGASIGDYLSQAHRHGGLAFGTTKTSALFLAVILVMVAYLTVSKRDTPVLTPSVGGA